jgi:hypothetical protein
MSEQAKAAPATVPVELYFPVTVGGETYNRFDMRRWKVADRLRIHRAGGDDAEKEIRMMADLCGVGTKVIEELDGSDYEQLLDAYRSFSSTAPSMT